MANELTIKLEIPVLPEVWNYDESIKKVKQWIYKWKTLTEEIAIELWIAREFLSLKPENQPRNAVGTFVPTDKNWDTYCKEINSSRQVVNRWLARWFGKELQSSETPLLPEGKFNVIYADPPWQYDNAGLEGAAEKHYAVLNIEAIRQLTDKNGKKIQECLADDCVLFLWTTNPFLNDALSVVEAWGFDYKTNMCWLKESRATYGKLGFYLFGQHELLFIATQGSMLPKGELPQSVIKTKKTKHSKKPIEFYKIIERMYPQGKYLELFARNNKRPNWTNWGLEA